MIIRIDGQTVSFENVENPVAILYKVQQKLGQDQRVLSALSINGVSAEGDWEETLGGLPADRIETIAFESLTPVELIQHALEDAANLAATMGTNCHQIGLNLQRGQDGDAIGAIPEVVDETQSLVGVVGALDENQILPEGIGNEIVEALLAQLQEVMTSWRREDLTVVSDLMRWELAPLLSQIEDTFAGIRHNYEVEM